MHITHMSHYSPGKTNKSTIQNFWGGWGIRQQSRNYLIDSDFCNCFCDSGYSVWG